VDTASPVVDDTTVRSVITNMVVHGWDNEVLDITTVFLHGKMEEEVCMTCPEGIELVELDWSKEEDCTRLLQTIYGTKQAARQYWKTFMAMMEKKGFQRTRADSCLLMRKDENGTLVICVYADDCLLTRDRQAIDAAIRDIEEALEIRRLGPVKE
jgi:hypothetical protein